MLIDTTMLNMVADVCGGEIGGGSVGEGEGRSGGGGGDEKRGRSPLLSPPLYIETAYYTLLLHLFV